MGTFLKLDIYVKTCKICESHEVDWDSANHDAYCSNCGAYQNEKYPIVSYMGHKWYVLFQVSDTHSRLFRVNWKGELKRRGKVDTGMDADIRGL